VAFEALGGAVRVAWVLGLLLGDRQGESGCARAVGSCGGCWLVVRASCVGAGRGGLCEDARQYVGSGHGRAERDRGLVLVGADGVMGFVCGWGALRR